MKIIIESTLKKENKTINIPDLLVDTVGLYSVKKYLNTKLSENEEIRKIIDYKMLFNELKKYKGLKLVEVKEFDGENVTIEF